MVSLAIFQTWKKKEMHLKEQAFLSPLLSRAHSKKFIRSLDKHIHWHHLLRKITEWQNTCLGHTKSWVQSVVKEKKGVRSAQGRSVVPLRITEIKFGGGVWVNKHTFKSPLHCTQIFVLWNSDTVKLTLGTYRLTYLNISIDSTTKKNLFYYTFVYFVCGGGVCHTACLWASEDNFSHHSGGPWDCSDHHA